MKEKKTDDTYLMRLAIMMPIVIAAAIWFSKKGDMQREEAEEMGLQTMLDRAVAEERYEDAVVLRDKLNRLRDK